MSPNPGGGIKGVKTETGKNFKMYFWLNIEKFKTSKPKKVF